MRLDRHAIGIANHDQTNHSMPITKVQPNEKSNCPISSLPEQNFALSLSAEAEYLVSLLFGRYSSPVQNSIRIFSINKMTGAKTGRNIN